MILYSQQTKDGLHICQQLGKKLKRRLFVTCKLHRVQVSISVSEVLEHIHTRNTLSGPSLRSPSMGTSTVFLESYISVKYAKLGILTIISCNHCLFHSDFPSIISPSFQWLSSDVGMLQRIKADLKMHIFWP